MVVQIKALTEAFMQLAATKENANPNATRGNGGGNCDIRQPQKKETTEHGRIL
jgi:hypothetical protein